MVTAPATKLQGGPFTTDTEFVNTVTRVDGVEITVHPTAEETSNIGTVGAEVEGYAEAIFIEWSVVWKS
jgi:hypothetical protein